jgi:hypothetical protein
MKRTWTYMGLSHASRRIGRSPDEHVAGGWRCALVDLGFAVQCSDISPYHRVSLAYVHVLSDAIKNRKPSFYSFEVCDNCISDFLTLNPRFLYIVRS